MLISQIGTNLDSNKSKKNSLIVYRKGEDVRSDPDPAKKKRIGRMRKTALILLFLPLPRPLQWFPFARHRSTPKEDHKYQPKLRN